MSDVNTNNIHDEVDNGVTEVKNNVQKLECLSTGVESSENYDTASSTATEAIPHVVAAKDINWSAENADGFAFRDYDNEENARFEIVKKAYSDMHENQTHAFVKSMHEKWRKFDKGEYTIMEIIKMYLHSFFKLQRNFQKISRKILSWSVFLLFF